MTAKQIMKEIEKRLNYYHDGTKREERFQVECKISAGGGVDVYQKDSCSCALYAIEDLVHIVEYNNLNMYVTVDDDNNKPYAHIY